MVITHYIKLIREVANRHDNISVSLLLLVVGTIKNAVNIYFAKNFAFDINLPNYLFI